VILIHPTSQLRARDGLPCIVRVRVRVRVSVRVRVRVRVRANPNPSLLIPPMHRLAR